MRYLLILPGIILMLLPILSAARASRKAEEARRQQEYERASAAELRRVEAARKQAIQAAKAAEREKARADREAEQQRKQAARLEAARLRAEYAERELAAKRAAKALDQERHENIPAEQEQPVGQAVEAQEPEQRPTTALFAGYKGNNAFKGHVVAFTGKLPGMTRREAIQAVEANGGRAYTKMPVGTTLLVVGENPGMCKMDKADEWIGQVRKITAAQFFAMLDEPLTIEADEFAARVAAQCA